MHPTLSSVRLRKMQAQREVWGTAVTTTKPVIPGIEMSSSTQTMHHALCIWKVAVSVDTTLPDITTNVLIWDHMDPMGQRTPGSET